MAPRELPAILNIFVGMGLLVRHVVSTALKREELAAAGVVAPTNPGRALDDADVAWVLGTLAVGWALAGAQAVVLRSAEATRRTLTISLGWCVYVAVSTWSMLDHPAASRSIFMAVCLVWTVAVLAHAREDDRAMWAPWSLGLATLVLAQTGEPAQTLLLLVVPAPVVAHALVRIWRRRGSAAWVPSGDALPPRGPPPGEGA